MVATDRLRGVSASVAIKAPCRVATTANITLSGLQTIDGVSVAADDRVLVVAQTDGTENGIYTADTGDWTRAIDFDGTGDCVQGTMVSVVAGTLYANSVWQLTTTDPDIGTDSLSFSIMGAAALGAVSAFMQTVLDDLTATAARTTLDAVGISNNETITGNKTFSGTVALGSSATATTPTAGDNDTSVPTTAFVQSAVAALTDVADANVAPTDTSRTIRYTSIAAARSVNLPAASGIKAGRTIDIVDASGSASSTNTISLVPNGTDTIQGSNTTQVAINVPRGRCRIVCNGSNGWAVLQWDVVYEAFATADTDLNNTANWIAATGVTVSQGTVGTWEVEAGVTLLDTAAAANLRARITDGTTVVVAATVNSPGTSPMSLFLRGRITAPAAGLKVEAKDSTATTGKVKADSTGNTNKDTYIRARRVA